MRCCSGCDGTMLIPVFLSACVRAELALSAVRVAIYHSSALFAERIAVGVNSIKLWRDSPWLNYFVGLGCLTPPTVRLHRADGHIQHLGDALITEPLSAEFIDTGSLCGHHSQPPVLRIQKRTAEAIRKKTFNHCVVVCAVFAACFAAFTAARLAFALVFISSAWA